VRTTLADLLRNAHEPTGFRPEIVDRFDALLTIANDQPVLASRIRLERLDYLARRGRWDVVLAEVSALEHDPGRIGAEATLVHAMVIYQIGDQETPAEATAMRACRERWESSPPELEALSLACGAWLAVFEKNSELAVRRAQEAQEIAPDLLPAILAEAVAWGRLLDIAKTQALIDRAQTLVPDHPAPAFLRVLTYAHVRNQDAALKACERALALVSPNPPWGAARHYAHSLYGLKRFDELTEFAKQGVVTNPSNPRWRFALGLVYAIRRRSPHGWRGLEILNELRETAPDAFRRGTTSFLRAGERLVVRRLDEVSDEDIRAGVLLEQGSDSLVGRGVPKDASQAAALFQKAAAAGNPEAAFWLGVLYFEGRGVGADRAQSLHWFQVGAKGGSPNAMLRLGTIYARKGAPEKAVHWWGETIKRKHANNAARAAARKNLAEIRTRYPQLR
jgi:tetratricopeptide (TPR) repeat protein